MNLAFVLLDPQIDFFGDDNPNLPAFISTIPVINRALHYFREHSLPVVAIQHTSPKLPAHTPKWEIFPEINIKSSDLILRMHYQNAFWKFPLNRVLHDKLIDMLLIAGYMAERCVLSTYRGAIERGYSPFLLSDGIAVVEHPEVVLRWCKNIDYSIIVNRKLQIY